MEPRLQHQVGEELAMIGSGAVSWPGSQSSLGCVQVMHRPLGQAPANSHTHNNILVSLILVLAALVKHSAPGKNNILTLGLE